MNDEVMTSDGVAAPSSTDSQTSHLPADHHKHPDLLIFRSDLVDFQRTLMTAW